MNVKNFGRKAYIILVALFVMAIVAPQSALAQQEAEIVATTLVKQGQKAPDFTVEMVDGEKVTLSSLKGKIVLINF